MKTGWPTVRFADVCELKKGRKPTVRSIAAEGDLPYLIAKQLRGREAAEFASPSDKNSVTVQETEIIIICDGSNSGETFIGHAGVLSSTMAKVVHAPSVDTRFLLFLLESLFEKFSAAKTGSAIPHLDQDALRQEIIPLPSIPEQRRIVGILDEAFAGIATAKANAEKNLQNARAVFESHLHAVFIHRGAGWVEKTFADLCDIKHGYAFEGEFFAAEGNYVLLTPGNFYEKGGYRDRGEKQKYYIGEIPRDYVLKEGDMLVAMTEQAAGLLGSPLLVPEPDRYLHNQRLGLVVPKAGAPWTNEFFFYAFNTRPVRQAIHDSASGVKVRHTSPTKIGEVSVPFPTSVAEQRRITARLDALQTETRRLEALYARKLAAIDELKSALLHQAFSGQL